MRAIALALALLIPAQAIAAEGDLVRFIACPVYRDVDNGRKSGCWLADQNETGVRYDITPSPTKPDWNHEVLVEGRVSANQDNACGGIVLEPVRDSVLDTPCPRHQLPAEGFKGRPFVLPERNVAPLSANLPPPAGPYTDRTFRLFFDFDKSFVVYQYDDYLLDQAIRWIRAANPRRIIITGYAATEPQAAGDRMIAERAQIAKVRAEAITEALRRAGIDPARIETRWENAAQPVDDPDADSLPEASRRRVEISVRM